MYNNQVLNLLLGYDVILCDIFGVIHNGQSLYNDAIEMLLFCKNHNIKVVLFSNSPRRSILIEKQLKELFNLQKGVDYDDIISSGEVFYNALKRKINPWMKDIESKSYFEIGSVILDPSFNKEIILNRVERLNEADFIIITNTWDESICEFDQEKRAMIFQVASAKKKVICINPDLIVPIVGNEIMPKLCAGAIAKELEDLNVDVVYYGKPYEQMYDFAFGFIKDKYNIINKNKILAIGDSINTDVKGANRNKIDCVFVKSGIHKMQTKDEVTKMLKEQNLSILSSINFL